jgi:hypothetical protein
VRASGTSSHRPAPAARTTTLLELVTRLAASGADPEQVARQVRLRVSSGSVRLVGQFQNAHVSGP